MPPIMPMLVLIGKTFYITIKMNGVLEELQVSSLTYYYAIDCGNVVLVYYEGFLNVNYYEIPEYK